MRKAIILARVSTKRQEMEGLSLKDIQLPELREYAEATGFEVAKEYEFSESADLGIRKKFDEMVEYVKKHKDVDAIIAYRVDRITRNFRDAVAMDELRSEYDKELHFVHDRLVITKSTHGRDIQDWDLKVFLAKQQINRLKEDGHVTKYMKLRNGELPWLAPFGYKNISISPRQKSVVIDEFSSRIVVKIFEYYATGTFSYKSLSTRIAKEFGVVRGPSIMANVLKQPFYKGWIYDEATDHLFPHGYETIIDDDLFDQVQAVIKSHGKKKIKYAGLEFAYRGLLQCSECGCAITPERKKKVQKNGNRHEYIYYHCTEKRGKHGAPVLTEDDLTQQFAQMFKSMELPESEYQKIEQSIRQSHEGKVRFTSEQLNYHETELKKAQARIEAAWDDKYDGSITTEEFEHYRAKQRDKQVQHEKALTRLRGADEQYYVTITHLMKLATMARELFEEADINEKRELIGLVGSNLFLDGKKLLFNLVKPFDTLALCNDNSLWLRLVETLRTSASDYESYQFADLAQAVQEYEPDLALTFSH